MVPVITNGAVVRENDQVNVYVMCGGTLVHIPTPDALFDLGFGWGDVTVLADGALVGYNPVEWPSLSSTPPSMVFPMNRPKDNGQPSPYTKWFARTEIPGLTLPNGNHLVAVSGVLHSIDPTENQVDPDWHMDLVPHADNLDAEGVDPARFFTVGDILHSDLNPFWDGEPATEPDRHTWVATPIYHIELCCWPANNVIAGPVGPGDWVDYVQEDQLWAFDPVALQPLIGHPVQVHGTLVTDEPHVKTGGSPNYKSAALDWQGEYNTYAEANPPRWTEIHPPDSIVVDTTDSSRDSLIGVAVVARTGPLDSNPITRTLDVTITCPVLAPTPTATLTVKEWVLPDTYGPSIINGNATRTGALVEILGNGEFRLMVEVQGDNYQGSAGRFAAIYRMSWVEEGKGKDEKEKEKEKEKEEEKIQKDKENDSTQVLIEKQPSTAPGLIPGTGSATKAVDTDTPGKAEVFIPRWQRPSAEPPSANTSAGNNA